jgi:hypothetical protein
MALSVATRAARAPVANRASVKSAAVVRPVVRVRAAEEKESTPAAGTVYFGGKEYTPAEVRRVCCFCARERASAQQRDGGADA